VRKFNQAIKFAVVDDDEGVQAALRTYFDLSRDFRIVGSFLSAGEALERIPQIGPDVVLMDIVMPQISGIECTRRLKLLLPDLPIVMLTALDDSHSLVLSLMAGATGYLVKPASPPRMCRCDSGGCGWGGAAIARSSAPVD
jgi:DNA-binding NarL/FixJ family response regulator